MEYTEKERSLLRNKLSRLTNQLNRQYPPNKVAWIIRNKVKFGILPILTLELLKEKIIDPKRARRLFSNNYNLKNFIYQRDGRICAECKSTRYLEIDHIKTINDFPHLHSNPDNLRVLCRSCNRGVRKRKKVIPIYRT